MATTCPVDLDTVDFGREIKRYTRGWPLNPSSEFHFHRGPATLPHRPDDDSAALAALPSESNCLFAGVAIPCAWSRSHQGRQSLTSGCGAGMDLMLAASAVGRRGLRDRHRHDGTHGGAGPSVSARTWFRPRRSARRMPLGPPCRFGERRLRHQQRRAEPDPG